MEFKIIPGYDQTEILKPLFIQYTDRLVAADPSFADYLRVQNYDEELADLNAKYGPPAGRLYLALTEDGQRRGCIAMKKIDRDSCEMKRLYVKEQYRGEGLGEKLARLLIDRRREAGYKTMLLDTLPFLQPAIALYEKLGFTRTEIYNNSPMDTSIFMKLEL